MQGALSRGRPFRPLNHSYPASRARQGSSEGEPAGGAGAHRGLLGRLQGAAAGGGADAGIDAALVGGFMAAHCARPLREQATQVGQLGRVQGELAARRVTLWR